MKQKKQLQLTIINVSGAMQVLYISYGEGYLCLICLTWLKFPDSGSNLLPDIRKSSSNE